MRVRRRTNPLWGLIVLAAALLVLGRTLGVVSEAVFDLIVRAAPALLVLAGVSFLLGDRVPLGGLVALIVTVALVAVIAVTAFSTRATQQREDNRQPIEQAIPPEVTLLRVRVQTLATGADIISTTGSTNVTGEYVGSTDNLIDVSYEQLADNSATLTLRETQESAFPRLETVGRGALQLQLPAGIPLDVEYLGSDGDLVLNMDGTSLERLNVTVERGNVVVTLPAYNPLFSQSGDLLGTLTARNGDLAMLIPSQVAARLELERGGSGIEPQFDPNVYNYLVGDVLEARNINTADISVRYALVVPRGRIRVEVPS